MKIIQNEYIDMLTDVLINHVSNWAEARLQQVGLTPASAHALHGNIIFSASNAYEKTDKHGAGINPKLYSMQNKTEEQVGQRLNTLQEYWCTAAVLLIDAYEKHTPTARRD